MCARFTWREVHALYELTGGRSKFAGSLQHCPDRHRRGREARRERRHRTRPDAPGPHSLLVDKAAEAVAGDLPMGLIVGRRVGGLLMRQPTGDVVPCAALPCRVITG